MVERRTTDRRQNSTTDILIGQIHEELKRRHLKDQQEELRRQMQSAPPFTVHKSGDEERAKRINLCSNDFWIFDKIYFPRENYQDYAPPGKFHHDLIDLAVLHDKKAHVVAGPRSHAKTAMYKKALIWLIIFGKRRYMQIASETLMTPVAFILDVMDYVHLNERLNFDYKIDFVEGSQEKLFVRTDQNPKGTFLDILSQDRSARGKNRGLFLRPDFIFITDFENETSSLTENSVTQRLGRLNEMRTSLVDKGTLIWEGNNFSTKCAMHQLFKEEEAGILSPNIIMHKYKAWDETRPPKQRSLWPQKYPAASESGLKEQLKPRDANDWAGNFQQEPREASGDIFPMANYREEDITNDIRAVIYCDPNLALKSKGDTTAIACLGFSVTRMRYYITAARCRSYSNSNELLMDLLNMYNEQKRRGVRIFTLGFDGNVNQESTWTNNLYNFCALHKTLFPHVEFKRYHVDDLVKSPELDWKSDKFCFPVGFRQTQEGKRFTDQVFDFAGKKAKKKDDAPDCLVSAYELLHEFGAVALLRQYQRVQSISNRNINERF